MIVCHVTVGHVTVGHVTVGHVTVGLRTMSCSFVTTHGAPKLIIGPVLQEYIHVVSRPMVIYRANHTVWTTIYHDSSVSGQQ